MEEAGVGDVDKVDERVVERGIVERIGVGVKVPENSVKGIVLRFGDE